MSGSHAATAVPAVADGLSGVVTSAKGPEAGVWVIAETKDLPTRFIKIVVTDDQGRYVLPGIAERPVQALGPRLWPGGFNSSHRVARPAGGFDRCTGPRREGGGAILSSQLLVLAAPRAAGQRVPWNRQKRERDCARAEDPTALAGAISKEKIACMCHQQGDQAYAGTCRQQRRRMGQGAAEDGSALLAIRPIGNDQRERLVAKCRTTWRGFGRDALVRHDGRLDQADRRRRDSAGSAAAAKRDRAQHRHHTEMDWGNGRFMHDIAATDRRDPKLSSQTDRCTAWAPSRARSRRWIL